jgi:hypothetical protein
VNTSPDNFFWEKDNTSVLATTPGLYEVIVGVFTRKKPTVHLLVNGEPVIRIESDRQGRSTAIDFIALPPRARVSMTYAGEPGAEAFLGLRKL